MPASRLIIIDLRDGAAKSARTSPGMRVRNLEKEAEKTEAARALKKKRQKKEKEKQGQENLEDESDDEPEFEEEVEAEYSMPSFISEQNCALYLERPWARRR